MRDLFVTMVILSSLPYILMQPHIGILMWSWVGYMNPHRLSWGFATTFPFAMIIAIVTLTALIFSKEPKRIPWTRETVVLAVFILWMCITTLFANYPDQAQEILIKVLKIQLMTFVTLMIMYSRQRIEQLVWVIALSLGFYGVKGGIFTITGGGANRVMGPDGTFIGGNNEIGLALIMTVPLLYYLRLQVTKKWMKVGFVVSMLLCAIALIGTNSRGALVGAIAMGAFFLAKSRKKFGPLVMVLVAAGIIASIMPQQWYDRMKTIETYEEDASAMGRVNAWHMAFNLASNEFFGGGFETFKPPEFERYAPEPDRVHDSHSIYFEVLGEHGFIGLVLFLLLMFFTWRTGTRVIRQARTNPKCQWAADLMAMVQTSLIGFAVAGAFLGLANFDFYYHLIAIVVLTRCAVERELAEAGDRAPEAARRGTGGRGARRTAKARAP